MVNKPGQFQQQFPPLFPIFIIVLIKLVPSKKSAGTAISCASNLCTAVGRDQNKEFRDNASFMKEKGPRVGIKYIAIVFSILTRKPKIIIIRSNLIYLLVLIVGL